MNLVLTSLRISLTQPIGTSSDYVSTRRCIYKTENSMATANFNLVLESDDENSNETPRFGSTSVEQQDDMLEDRNKFNTRCATKSTVKILTDYLAEKKLKNLPEILDEELPNILYNFYTDLRSKKGQLYKLQSLKCIHAGVNRYMKEMRNIDIIKDLRFTKTNEMFKAVSHNVCEKGLGTTKSYPPIEDDDMALISAYFDHDHMNHPDPRKLHKAVIFLIIYYFCRRGRENIYGFTRDMFEISCEPNGTEFIFQAKGEEDKNHEIDNTTHANDGRMYEQKGK